MAKKLQTKIIDPSKKKKSFLKSTFGVVVLTIVFGLAISAGGYYGLVKPQLDRISMGGEFNLATASSTLEQNKRDFNALKLLKSNFDEIDSRQIKLLSQALPVNKSTPELLSQLETIARQNGVQLERISMTEVEEVGPSARQRIQQQVEGVALVKSKDITEVIVQVNITAFSYKSFKDFVTALQNHRRILDVETLLYQSDQDSQRVTFKTYFLEL